MSRDRTNNFAFIRIFAAFLVIIGHSQSLVGVTPAAVWGHSVSTVGVMLFFGLSGYLVTQSWQYQPSYLPFLCKRSLRIFPALIACVLITTYLLGPAVSNLGYLDYVASPLIIEYLKNIVLLPRYALPEVFSQNIYPNAVNGSLWSLPVEYVCYLLVAILAFGPRTIRTASLVAACATIYGFWIWYTQSYNGPQIVIWGTDAGQATSIMPYFFVGAILCGLQGRVPLNWKVGVALLLALLMVDHLFQEVQLGRITWVLVPYITLSIGWASWPIVKRFDRFGDPSYGMYLYAFPIQQTIVYITQNSIDAISLIVWTTVFSTVAGYISWHILEKQALKLKPKSLA